MYNLEIFFICVIVILFIFNIILKIENVDLTKKINNLQKIQKEYLNTNKKVDFKYAEEAMNFLDKLIQEKYRFYLYSTMMPIYSNGQIPEKKEVKEIKNKIYLSIIGGLTTETKRSLLNFFTKKGIEIYIHEKIIGLMNETDFKVSNRNIEIFKNTKGKKLDILMP